MFFIKHKKKKKNVLIKFVECFIKIKGKLIKREKNNLIFFIRI